MRTFILLTLILTTCFCSAASRPHIIHILVDDMGWNDVSYHGSEIQTPHIDQLAKEGARLDQFYVQPTCTPTRAAMMTGRYPLRYDLHRSVLRPWHKESLPLSETTIATQLKKLGYTTAICGKWHLGMHATDQTPLGRGFDHQYGHHGGHIDFFKHTYYRGRDWHRNDEPLDEPGYATKLIADEAIRLIDGHAAKKPLYLFLPFNAPHLPLQAPQEWLDKYSHLQPKARAQYAAMMANLDHHIGRVLQSLESSAHFKNTLVFFSSDNGGGPTKTHGADNTPLRGNKGLLYEGGIRVPAIIIWKDVIPAGKKIEHPLHAVDLFPTFIAAAGKTVPKTLHLDGSNILPLFKGEHKPTPEREIVLNTTGTRAALRKGKWKILKNPSYEQPINPPIYELYNLDQDPEEKHNVIQENPEVAKQLITRVNVWSKRQDQSLQLGQKKKPENFKAPKVWQPLQVTNSLESQILELLKSSNNSIDTIEIFGVKVDAERRFSYKVEPYRDHLFIRIAAGEHSGWAEINLGDNPSKQTFDQRIWRTKWMKQLKGMTLEHALNHIITQRDIVHYPHTEAAEMALLDLAGKCLNVPTIELLQLNKTKPVAGLYTILSDDPAKVTKEAQFALKQNLKTHLKVKLYGDLDTDLNVIRAARSVYGGDAFLIGDVNTGYRKELNQDLSIDDLLPSMKTLHKAGLTCIEDPANLSSDQWAKLSQKSAPLTLCPDVPTRPAWKALKRLDPSMGQVFNMHPAGMGSIIETIRLGHWIQSHNKNLMVGDSSLVGPACSAWQQIAIGLGADWVEAVEKPQESTTFQDCVISNPVQRTSAGKYHLPKPAPGFGIKIDHEKLKAKSFASISL